MPNSKPAILVDYDMYTAHLNVRQWLKAREDSVQIVLLVGDPRHHDYNHTSTVPEVNIDEFAAILRNTGGLPDIAFKTTALCVVQDSKLIPTVGLDSDYTVQRMYEDGGLLFGLGENDL